MPTNPQTTEAEDLKFAKLSTQQSPVSGAAIGCFALTILIFGGGIIFWLIRPAEWRIPGFVCFIIIAIGLAGINVTRKDVFGSKPLYECPHCTKLFTVVEGASENLKCPSCNVSIKLPIQSQQNNPSDFVKPPN